MDDPKQHDRKRRLSRRDKFQATAATLNTTEACLQYFAKHQHNHPYTLLAMLERGLENIKTLQGKLSPTEAPLLAEMGRLCNIISHKYRIMDRQACDYFEQALALDSTNALARTEYSGLRKKLGADPQTERDATPL